VIGDILQPTHLLFVLIVALLVLGPKRLPEVARTLGTGLRDFRSAISGESTDSSDDEPTPHISSYESPAQSVAPDPETPVAEPVGATPALHSEAEPSTATATATATVSEPATATVSEPVGDPATFHFPTRPPIDTDDAAADERPAASAADATPSAAEHPAPVDDQAETRQFEPEHGSTSA
jgi:TatA/E family protein of Tat protein translocase